MKILEKHIQKAILKFLKFKKVFCWANKTQGTFDPKRKVFRANVTEKGISDILGIINGKFLAIEVKRVGGTLTQKQIEFLEKVNREGGIGFVARSIKDVESHLDNEFKCRGRNSVPKV